jgi:DNA-binding transcriptional regulator YhcF (GntR family)
MAVSLHELAKSLGLARNTVTRAVRDLEAAGVIATWHEPGDGLGLWVRMED